ncbi:DNA helicase [Tanacetum coccineum]
MPMATTFHLLDLQRVFFVLPFGGVSASEGVPSANCPTDNSQLYLNVFQKCSEFCGGNLRRERTTTFRVVCRTQDAKLYSDVYQKYRHGCKEVWREGPNTISDGTPSAADVMHVDCESQKLKSTDGADVFRVILLSVQGVLVDVVQDFFEVQTINDVLYPTYRAACEALGLLGDDKRRWKLQLESLLNVDQKAIYDLIMNADENSRQELIFVYGHGGTVASSCIAYLLLPSGHTAHSRFKFPLELTEESLCRITKNTQLGKLLADTDLIIWDEFPMNDRRCFEALDRILRDIVNKSFSLFWRKVSSLRW